MGSARAEAAVDRPADQVWAAVGDFARPGWIPGIAFWLQDDRTRIVSMQGREYEERLLRVDDDARSYTYSVVRGLRAEHHEATISVRPDGTDRCLVTWDVVTDDRLVAPLRDHYAAVLAALTAQLEGRT